MRAKFNITYYKVLTWLLTPTTKEVKSLNECLGLIQWSNLKFINNITYFETNVFFFFRFSTSIFIV